MGEFNERARRRACLMAGAQRGDTNAYAELLNEIGPTVIKFLRRRVQDADAVQDLYQEIFLSLHRARHTYQPTRPLEPWLFAIARHIVADHEQRRRARLAREVLVDSPPVLPLTDFELISAGCDSQVFVIRGGYTNREMIRRASAQLDSNKLLGPVFNMALDPTPADYRGYPGSVLPLKESA